ncbi:hypothetical protein H311_01966 [Anncaliia algerae PRA109]|nr:hypothetical protein H311_01966 [Anncaliia algerae PRA109]
MSHITLVLYFFFKSFLTSEIKEDIVSTESIQQIDLQNSGQINKITESPSEDSQLDNIRFVCVSPDELLEVYIRIRHALVTKLGALLTKLTEGKKYFTVINLKKLGSSKYLQFENFTVDKKLLQEILEEGSFLSDDEFSDLVERINDLINKNKYIPEDELPDILNVLREIITKYEDLMNKTRELLHDESNTLKNIDIVNYYIFNESLLVMMGYYIAFINLKITNMEIKYSLFLKEKDKCVKKCNKFLINYVIKESKNLFGKIKSMEFVEEIFKSLISKNEHSRIFDILIVIKKINQLKLKTNNFEIDKENFVKRNKNLFEFILNNEFNLNYFLEMIDYKDLVKILSDLNLGKYKNRTSKTMKKYKKIKKRNRYATLLGKILEIEDREAEKITKKEYVGLLKTFFKLNCNSYHVYICYNFDVYTIKDTFAEIINYLEQNVMREIDKQMVAEKKEKMNEYISDEDFNGLEIYFGTFFKGKNQKSGSTANRIICELLRIHSQVIE